MNRDSDIEKFWNLVERKMTIVFPLYLRNILKLRGYDCAGSIKYITKADIDHFENFAKTAMEKCLPESCNRSDYFSIFKGPTDFEIIPGHKILLLEVASFVKEMTEQHGNDYFNFYDNMGSSSQPFLNKRASQVLMKAKVSNCSSLVSDGQDEEESAEDSYIKQEQTNLIKKVKAWLKKKADTPSQKYSNEINEDTVVMSVKMVGKIQKLCARVRCFICDEKIGICEIRKVLVDNSIETYLSASNYYTHIQLHQKKDEMRIVVRNTADKKEDTGDSCDDAISRGTESQQPKKISKTTPKSKKILDRFRAQNHGSAQNVRHIPHTVTSEHMRPYSKTEDVELKGNVQVGFQGSTELKRIQNESESESVSQLKLDSTEKFEELPSISTVNLADGSNSDKEDSCHGTHVLTDVQTTKEVYASIRKRKLNGFQPELIKIKKSAKNINHIGTREMKKKSKASTRMYGQKKAKRENAVTFVSEDDLDSDVNSHVLKRSILKKNENFGSKKGASSKIINQIHSKNNPEMSEFAENGEVISVLCENKGRGLQATVDERKGKLRTELPMIIRKSYEQLCEQHNEKDLEKGRDKNLSEDSGLNENICLHATSKIKKQQSSNPPGSLKNKGKIQQRFQDDENVQYSREYSEVMKMVNSLKPDSEHGSFNKRYRY